MTASDLAGFEQRLRTLLPEIYKVFDEDVKPVSMGSAGLRYGPDGKVPWNEIWGSFCDLAMAGGPPHRGTFLDAPEGETADTPAYIEASTELCRGLTLVTGLFAEPAPVAGWVRMYCTSVAMSGWLARSIVMENVAARSRGLELHLPIGAGFRVDKEIKNVITSVAKTCHYWQDHMSDVQHDSIADLLATMEREHPLLYPDATSTPAEALQTLRQAGLQLTTDATPGWLGLDCTTIPAAIAFMRALAVGNLLARRTGTVVFLPLSNLQHPGGTDAILYAHQLSLAD